MFSIFDPLNFILLFGIAPVIAAGGGAAGGPISLAGAAWLRYLPKLLNILGGKRNTGALVPGVSFPGYDAQGNPLPDDTDYGDYSMPTNIISTPPISIPGPGSRPINQLPSWQDIIGGILGGISVGKGVNQTIPNVTQANNDSSTIPDWLKNIMPFLLTGLGGLAGGLENRAQKSSSDITHTQEPGVTDFRNNLISRYMTNLGTDPDLSGYQANQLSENNRLYGLQQQNLSGDLASRGIRGPAADLATAGLDQQRFGSNVQFSNIIPLLARSLRDQTLSNAGNFFGSLPTNVNTKSETAGNVAGGVTGGLAEMLALLYGLKG